MSGAKTSKRLASAKQDAALKKKFSTNASPASATVDCAGGMSREPCDVTGIRVSDSIGARTVIAQSRAMPRLESNYDFIYEVIADKEDSAPTAPKRTTVALEAPYAGRCPIKAHPDVRWYPTGNPLRACTKLLMDLPAPTENGRADKSGWAALGPAGPDHQDYDVIATSCGVRTEGAANETLRGLVRVFRPDVWEITIEFPPFRSWEYEREAYYQAKKKSVSVSSTKWSKEQFGTEVAGSERSTERSLDGRVEVSKTRDVTGRGLAVSTERTAKRSPRGGPMTTSHAIEFETASGPEALGGVASAKMKTSFARGSGRTKHEIERELSIDPVFDITIKRNGQELEIVDVVESLVNMTLKVQNELTDLIKCLPQAGLKFSCEVSLFEGSISGGRRRVLGPAHGRVARVEEELSITVAIKLLCVKLKASFGLEAKTEGFIDKLAQTEVFALVATIELAIEGSIDVEGTISPSERSVTGEGEIKPSLSLNGHATILGDKYGIEGVLKGGITGKATVDLSQAPLRVSGVATQKAVTVVLIRFSSGNKTTTLFERKFLEEQELFNGPVFGQ